MFLGAGIGDDASGRYRAVAQGPEEFPVPGLAQFRRGFDIGQCASHALVGIVDGQIDRRTVFCLQPVFLLPDIL